MDHHKLVKAVHWQDLVKLSTKEMLIENNITLPWLGASLLLAYFEWYLMAAPFSLVFFLTALRQSHNGFHRSLGTGHFLTWVTLFGNSVLMLASMHAVKYNHLRHHKYCLEPQDVEGRTAKLKWYEALLCGPIHIWQIHAEALKGGSRDTRKRIILELIALTFFGAASIYFQWHFLIYHIIVMCTGEILSGFFAVWTVHHDLEEHEIARTQRKGWKNRVSFSMFYHLEHHLFPAVPTIKLKELAKRIDDAYPEWNKKQTF